MNILEAVSLLCNVMRNWVRYSCAIPFTSVKDKVGKRLKGWSSLLQTERTRTTFYSGGSFMLILDLGFAYGFCIPLYASFSRLQCGAITINDCSHYSGRYFAASCASITAMLTLPLLQLKRQSGKSGVESFWWIRGFRKNYFRVKPG